MESSQVVALPGMSLRRFLSSFVRKSAKHQRHRRNSFSKAHGSQEVEFPSKSRTGDATSHWGNELSAYSFLEMSSEVVSLDAGSLAPVTENSNEDGPMPEKGNLWNDEARRKCSELAASLNERLCGGTLKQNGICLKFPSELPERIAHKIVSASSFEPCGLRGCCVNLRLLHEDIATALMTSHGEDHTVSVDRAKKCASWPNATANSGGKKSCPQRPSLDFTMLPDMDATLTGNLCFDLSTDSGFCDLPSTHGEHTRLKHSLSSFSVPILPSLSAASRLHVACADVGQLNLCDTDSVPTFEIYVYLAPATSWTWRIRKLFFSSLQFGSSGGADYSDSSKMRSVLTVSSDFTIVKKKLYRTHSSPLEVERCPPQQTLE